jgi:hypothetical protein
MGHETAVAMGTQPQNIPRQLLWPTFAVGW